MENRPKSETKTSKSQKVQYRMPEEEFHKMVIGYLRKVYPEFRNFADDEYEFLFESETIQIDAYKEWDEKK